MGSAIAAVGAEETGIRGGGATADEQLQAPPQYALVHDASSTDAGALRRVLRDEWEAEFEAANGRTTTRDWRLLCAHLLQRLVAFHGNHASGNVPPTRHFGEGASEITTECSQQEHIALQHDYALRLGFVRPTGARTSSAWLHEHGGRSDFYVERGDCDENE